MTKPITKTILFVHCAGAQGPGEGSSGLVRYLHKALGTEYRVHSPLMPDPKAPSCSAWQSRVEQELIGCDEKVLLIGHSLGGSVAMKCVTESTRRHQIAGLFLVAAPYWGIDEEWQSADCQLADGFQEMLASLPHLYLYHSREDEIVPFAHIQAYHSKLPQAHARVLDGGDHYFEAGLAQLAEDVKRR